MKKKESIRAILKAIPLEHKEIVLDYLRINGATKSNTPELYGILNKKTYRGLEDIFRYLELKEDLLIKEKIGRAYYWRLKDKKLIVEKLSQKDLNSLTYAIELEKEHFDKSTVKAIEKVFETNNEYMIGHLSLYEEFQNSKISEFYDDLIDAIKNHKYLRLEFLYDKIAIYNDVKPIKIVFIDNNWYIAFEYTNDNKVDFIFRRLAFMKNLTYLKYFKYSKKDKFQIKDIQKYIDFIDNAQNSMTLYGVEKKIAILKATPLISKYFKEDMKRFLSSQKFKEELDDGSVIFNVTSTNDLEILPFIQKWLPDLIILEPQELRDAYGKKLHQTLQNLSN